MLEERKLHFPEKNVGSVFLYDNECGIFSSSLELEAAGTIFVPQGVCVRLEINEVNTQKQNLSFLETLKPNDIQSLTLAGHMITDLNMRVFWRLTGLTELEFSSTDVTGEGLAGIEYLSKLRRLNFSHTNIGNTGVVHLRSLHLLEWLNLFNVGLTDPGLAYLKELKTLRMLSLRLNEVTSIGVANLEELIELRRLDLSDTEVTDSGLTHLQTLTKLEALYLERTKTSQEGLKDFTSRMPNCQIYLRQDPADGSWKTFD